LPIASEGRQEEISGNTLRVYWYVLKRKEGCGVREIQRALGFSSSSSAHYHLEKLADKGFLTRNEYGSYHVNGKVRSGVISPFVVVRGFVFPRQLLYAVVTTLFNALFLLFLRDFLSLTIVLALVPGILACLIFWYETIRLWPSLPSFEEDVR
jgi:predicted DNA-binding transcriptional regulator